MSKIKNFDEAIALKNIYKDGIFAKNNGAIVKGTLDVAEDKNDDPDGNGWMGIEVSQAEHVCITAEEFAWAEFDD